MFWAINERFDVEHQVVRAICYEIARGGRSPGNTMPSPQILAKERILNPRVVESAYTRLTEAGILKARPGGDFQVAGEALRLARTHLLDWAEAEVQDLAHALRSAGLSREDIQRVFREGRDD